MARMALGSLRQVVTGVQSKTLGFIASSTIKMRRLPIVGRKIERLLFDKSMLARTYLPNFMIVALSFSGGITPSDVEISPELRAELDKIEWIDLGGRSRIMKSEVTIGLFNQVMEGYKITGHNAEKLKALLARPAQESDALTYVSLLDAREFAKRLSDLTGRRFRIPANEEWSITMDRLSGDNYTWTEKKSNDQMFILRHLFSSHYFSNPEHRLLSFAIRLVEDIG